MIAKKSRVEINFIRLMDATTNAISNEDVKKSFGSKLKKYIEALDDFLFDMKNSPNPPSDQALEEYTKKLKVVRGLIISDEMPSVEEKSAALDGISHGEESVGEDTTLKILHQRFKAACERKMKEQLLEKEGGYAVKDERKKLLGRSKMDEKTKVSSEKLLENQRQKEEKAISNILGLARDMKDQAQISNKIINADIKSLNSCNELADDNAVKLGTQMTRLKGHINSFWCLGRWLLLIIAFMLFLVIVWIIKLFPKPVYRKEL